MFKKLLLPIMLASSLLLSACSSDEDVEKDEIPDLSQQVLHSKARQFIAKGDFASARDYLEALDSRYPFGELTDQVQLDLIYAYYKTRRSDQTTATIERYLRLNPTSQYLDYVLYLKGLNEIQKHGTLIQDFLGFDRSQKDPQFLYDAYRAFSDLLETYPNSPYAKDAYKRLVFVKTELAKREWAIVNYYQQRGALISAIRHCQTIIYTYADTEFAKPAFELMADNYDALGLKLPSEHVRQVLNSSHFEE